MQPHGRVSEDGGDSARVRGNGYPGLVIAVKTVAGEV